MAEKSPFLAGPMITDPRFFVGRQQELEIILSRMIGDQPISINLVGPKCIGKSSLLCHLYQTYEERLSGKGVDPKNYAMVYLSVKGYDSEPKLYEKIADKLLKALPNNGIAQRLGFQQNPVKSQLQARPLNRHDFSQAIRDCKESEFLPVLCLDSFDNLGKKKNSFDLGFYENLRSLMDSNDLMLIIASRQPLDKLLPKHYYRSFFGNVGHSMTLKKSTKADAETVARLPAFTSDDAFPALSPNQQKLTLNWGKQHP
ncbi:ATP-binding protein [Sodalinema gerasimenkoae]|uniref:ATP-binding protein n=1 Tax=Sodalinema gerasimenkoae TaxID=2862348 RepID=UPI001356D195|nr:ATP-binding protein [Sodalinema gerasimenkoae]